MSNGEYNYVGSDEGLCAACFVGNLAIMRDPTAGHSLKDWDIVFESPNSVVVKPKEDDRFMFSSLRCSVLQLSAPLPGVPRNQYQRVAYVALAPSNHHDPSASVQLVGCRLNTAVFSTMWPNQAQYVLHIDAASVWEHDPATNRLMHDSQRVIASMPAHLTTIEQALNGTWGRAQPNEHVLLIPVGKTAFGTDGHPAWKNQLGNIKELITQLGYTVSETPASRHGAYFG